VFLRDIELADEKMLIPVDWVEFSTRAALAAKIGSTWRIDHVVLYP